MEQGIQQNATYIPKTYQISECNTQGAYTVFNLTINAHSSFVTSSLIAGDLSVSIECLVI
jgi:hypothetical protein